MNLIIDERVDDTTKEWEISLKGDLDIASSNSLKDKLTNLIEKNPYSLNLEIKELNYIDSTGLGVLLSILNKLKSNGVEMKLSNPKPNVHKLFKITGLNKVFRIVEDEE
jgi:anti-sigma B factor antagonist